MNVSFYGIKALRTDAIKVEVHSLLQIVTVFYKEQKLIITYCTDELVWYAGFWW